jgi:hypothetical protein
MDQRDQTPDPLARSHPLRVALIVMAIICNVAAPMTAWPQQVRLLGYGLIAASMIILAVAFAQSGAGAADKRRLVIAGAGLLVALSLIYLLATRSVTI